MRGGGRYREGGRACASAPRRGVVLSRAGAQRGGRAAYRVRPRRGAARVLYAPAHVLARQQQREAGHARGYAIVVHGGWRRRIVPRHGGRRGDFPAAGLRVRLLRAAAGGVQRGALLQDAIVAVLACDPERNYAGACPRRAQKTQHHTPSVPKLCASAA